MESEIRLKELKFKVGDEVIIAASPPLWSSLLNKNDPMYKDIYPYKCTIKEIKDSDSYIAMTCGSYGWDLSSLIKYNLITKVEKIFVLPRNWCIDARKLTLEEQDSVVSFVEKSCPYSFKKFIKTHIPHFTENKFINGYSRKGYVEITFEQFKKYILKENMDKKIIGYKLVKPEYETAAVSIINPLKKRFKELDSFLNNIDFEKNSHCYDEFVKAGILDLWFEPVYEPQFQSGDYVKWKGTNPCVGVIDYRDDFYDSECYVLKNTSVNRSYNSCSIKSLQKITKEEYEKEYEKETLIKIKDYPVKIYSELRIIEIGCKKFTFDDVESMVKSIKAGLIVQDSIQILKLWDKIK